MRRAGPTLAIVALAVALAGCGGEQTVSPAPETVVGSVPTEQQTTTQATTTEGTTSGPTTTSGGNGGGGGASDGKSVFASNGCGSCHTYQPAGSKGMIGPDLDKLAQYAKQANQPLDAFVRESIQNPKAYVQPGFSPVMPSYASLPKSDLDALVKFLTAK